MKTNIVRSTLVLGALLALLLGACAPASTATTAVTQPAATTAALPVTASPVTPAAAPATAAPPAAAPAGTALPAADPATLASYAQELTLNSKAWNYDATNDVYWQIGNQYVVKPESTDFETLGIYVPGAYMTATANGDGAYTATPNAQGSINGFTAKTAPIVFPVNTPGYSETRAPTAYNYDSVASYLQAGFVYVEPGLRGRQNGYDANGKLIYSGGIPWGVTDLKAAVRYIRYNNAALPGDPGSMFVFGMSGGGAQSAVMGASGDSPLYYPYLESIGAAMYDAQGAPISDAIRGVMAWCPITSLDYADQAYEWNMGQYASTDTRAATAFTSVLSKDLATSFAEYINKLGIKDEKGSLLALEKTDSGIYAAGSYYDYLKSTIETSLNNFLADTTFPYTESTGGMGGPGGPGGFPGGPGGPPPNGALPAVATPAGTSAPTPAPKTYQTAQDYIDSLNQDMQWVTYDAATNTATISSVADFVTRLKPPTKSVAAFDNLNRGAGENDAFGNDANDALHFDPLLAGLLAKNQAAYAAYSDWKASYVSDYATDLQAVDKLGNGMQYRMNMYNPMYYLLDYYDGYQSSNPARSWRINTGIDQGDTANTVEMNLALALENYPGVKDVQFTTVWNQGHTQAERTGDSTTNFINWVIGVVNK